jgi:nucleoside-diphosphate kinase
VYQGRNAIRRIRDIAGPTNPHVAREKSPGCIRALGTVVPLKSPDGQNIGERMDNLVHASATAADAEREIKLWFKPNDIPPLLRVYESVVSDEHFYFKDGKLFKKHETGSVCLLAPGDTVWKSDLEALQAMHAGSPSRYSVQAVAAKYLINENLEDG